MLEQYVIVCHGWMLMVMLLLLCDDKLFVLAYTGSAVLRYAVSECCSCFMLVLVCWYVRNIRACWKSDGNRGIETCTDRGTYGKWGFGNRRLWNQVSHQLENRKELLLYSIHCFLYSNDVLMQVFYSYFFCFTVVKCELQVLGCICM